MSQYNILIFDERGGPVFVSTLIEVGRLVLLLCIQEELFFFFDNREVEISYWYLYLHW